MTREYSESVETVVGGGPHLAPIGPAPPPLADALRAPSRLRNVIEEEIDDKQRGMPQGSGLTAGTHLAIADRTISCTLVGGTHLTVDGEEMNHDEPGEHAHRIAESGVWSVPNAWIDATGHVRLD